METKQNLPPEPHELVDDLDALCDHSGIVPAKMMKYIECNVIKPRWEYTTDRDDSDLVAELIAMKDVKSKATRLSTTGSHESQWYCSVQWPILYWAFRAQPQIQPDQMYALI